MTDFGRGFVVNLDELVVLLEYISHDVHRWEAVGDDTEAWDDTQSVIIRYSNPGEIDLPNQISFRFPCVDDSNPLFPARLACLHASLAEPVSRGLYLDEGDVKYDCIGDWAGFWSPILRALSSRRPWQSACDADRDNIS